MLLDPKEDWALRHLEFFPVEINRADYGQLLRVPGIGVKSAKRIIGARRSSVLRFEDLKKIGVVMKRALYFITCGGKMLYPTRMDEDYIARNLLADRGGSRRENALKQGYLIGEEGVTYRQLSLFDDVNFGPEKQRACL